MAEGYARASGKVGVAIATSGPGATNLVTPIADAWMDSTPLVCITGQVRSNLIGTDAFQETDATGITMPIVKHSWLVQDVRGAARRDEGGVPRRPHAAGPGPCSSTSPRTRRKPSSTSSTPTRSTCPAGSRRRRCTSARCARRRRRSPRRSAADRLRGRRRASTPTPRAELLALVEAGAPPGGRDADGQGLPARLASAELRRARACTARSTATGR